MSKGKKAKKQIEKGSNSHDHSSNTGTTISHLNNDCLRCILAYLPMKDRFRLQRVSKRWQTLMPRNGVNKLSVCNNILMLGQQGWMTFSPAVLEQVLHFCGNFITDVKVSFWNDELNKNTENYLKMFKHLCPNLVNLNLRYINVTKPLIKFLIQNFADLKSFGIGGGFAEGCEKELTKFFSKAKNLCEIQFCSTTLRGTCLNALPLESLEKFNITGLDKMSLGNVCKALQKMNNLSSLCIVNNLVLIDNYDRLLNELPNKSKLESLSLHLPYIPDRSLMMPDLERIESIKNLRHLNNLQELSLVGPQLVHDEALTIIGNTCTKLKKAILRDSYKLTDNGWKNFAKLASIEELRIGELDTISDKCFDYLQASSLTSLVCYKIGLTNKSLRVLLKSATKLKCLDVALCPQVDFKTLIRDASAQIESRPKHESFTLRLEIDDSTAKISNISSRLIVENNKLLLDKKIITIFSNLISD